MRFLTGFVVVLFATSALHAQPRADDVVVRGCVSYDPDGYLALRALGPSLQAFDSQNRVEEGQLFSLLGNGATMNALMLFVGDEVEITGRLNPENPIREVPGPVLEPPVGVGIPGPSGQQIPRGPDRVLSRRPSDYDEVEIQDHKFLRPGCRSR